MSKLLRLEKYVLYSIKNICLKMNNHDWLLGNLLKILSLCNYNRQNLMNFNDWIFYSLNLFYGNDSILRVKIHICGSKNFTFNKKFPTLLKKKLIVWKSNKDVCHSEVDSTFNFIRSNFWIIRGQKTEEKLLKSCFICKILHGKNNDISLYSSITNICSILQLYLWNRRSRFYRPIVM